MNRKNTDEKIREAPMTYDDYASIDDGNRYELAEGALELLTSPNSTHQLLVHRLSYLMEDSCGSEYFILEAPIDVIFGKNEVRQPDLIAIHRTRLSIISKRGIEGTPDLVVEVLSLSTAKRDRSEKMEVYAKYLVQEYWIVDPANRTLEQYTLKNERYELLDVYDDDTPIHSEKMPCASFSVNELWSRIPELPNDKENLPIGKP